MKTLSKSLLAATLLLVSTAGTFKANEKSMSDQKAAPGSAETG